MPQYLVGWELSEPWVKATLAAPSVASHAVTPASARAATTATAATPRRLRPQGSPAHRGRVGPGT